MARWLAGLGLNLPWRLLAAVAAAHSGPLRAHPDHVARGGRCGRTGGHRGRSHGWEARRKRLGQRGR